MNISILNGHLVDPANDIDAVTDLHIQDEHILAIGEAPTNFKADKTIDASESVVMPGIIDLCTRLGEPGFEKKADIHSESLAAISSGVTSLCTPPDTNPVIDTPADVKFVKRREQAQKLVRIHVIAALTTGLKGAQLSEMASLKKAGCVAVSNAQENIPNYNVLRRALEYATSLDIPVIYSPQNTDLTNDGCAHEGAVSTRLGLPGIPEAAETSSIGFLIPLIEQTGATVHFSHISSATGMNMIRRAHHDGVKVTADVCIHQLFLTEMDIADFNPLCHTRPPLRTIRDRETLRKGLTENGIQAISSDHWPHEDDAKLAPFGATEPGISGLETLLPLSLRLVEEGVLNLSEMVSLLTIQPAKTLGLNLGHLSEGAPADICIFDPNKTWEFTIDNMKSRGKNSPFDGWFFKGQVQHTLMGGELVYSDE